MVWLDFAEDKGQGVNHDALSLYREVQMDWNVPVIWPAEVSWCGQQRGQLRSDKSEGPHQKGVFVFHLSWMKAGRLPGLRLELSGADGDAGQWEVFAEGLTCLG